MTHVRTQIRDEIVAQLTGLPTTGNNVVAGRAMAVNAANTPALRIYTDTDNINPDRAEMDETTEYHDLSAVIEVHTRSLQDSDALMDQIHVEIQAALLDDVLLGGLAEFTSFQSLTVEQLDELDEPITVGTLTYRVEYRVNGLDLETPIQ